MQRWVWIAVAFLLVPSAALAGVAAEEDYTKKIADLQSEILGILLLEELKLERGVMREILTLAYHARQITDAYEERTVILSKKFEKACREFREEDFENKGFSKRVEKRAESLEHKLQAERKRYCEAINELEEKVAGLLTPFQTQIFKRFPSRFKGRSMARLLGGKPLLRPLPKALHVEFSRIRSISSSEWSQRKVGILGDWVRRFEKVREPFTNPEAGNEYRKRLETLLEDVRGMSEEEFKASGEKILEALKPPAKLDEISKDLRKIGRDHYGGIGRIGRFLWDRCAIPLLEKRLGLKPGEGKPAGVTLKKADPSKSTGGGRR